MEVQRKTDGDTPYSSFETCFHTWPLDASKKGFLAQGLNICLLCSAEQTIKTKNQASGSYMRA